MYLPLLALGNKQKEIKELGVTYTPGRLFSLLSVFLIGAVFTLI